MKVGIVTVYQSYNCGSFLQAYAMQQTLEDFGCQPRFLKNKRTRRSRLWYRMMQAVKYVYAGKPQRAKHLLKVYDNFRRAQRRLTVTAGFTGIDTAVYGSDTIWNIDQKSFLNNWRRFYGADFNGRKIVYAASVGDANEEKLLSHKQICSAVTDFDAIAVRDGATWSFVKACCGVDRHVDFVADPTMLLPVQTYEALAPKLSGQGYILFYYFGAIPEYVKKQVREFADETNRKIVVFGEDDGWADAYVSNDPFLMLGYYKNADYVITNTFHGNVFSIIFNKQFISFGKEKQKVCDLLDTFGLSKRLLDTDAPFVSLFGEEIDYCQTNEKLASLRTHSLEYLHNAIFSKKDLEV